MATASAPKTCWPSSALFPINRRHQGLATLTIGLATFLSREGFQSIGVTKDWRPKDMEEPCSKARNKPFPINRRHQGLATLEDLQTTEFWLHSFQSIGVTKDWRRVSENIKQASAAWKSFQSIGVTKDWRRCWDNWHANGWSVSNQ